MDSTALHLHLRDLFDLWTQPPPEPRTRLANNPTLLFSWWTTCFSAAIIITRLCGRKIRSNMLFREDWIMMVALAPLFIRMAFIHVVLLHGTNNVYAAHLSELQIEKRELGSRMVLAARIFYAMFIWLSKLTVSEFLKRITIRIWRRSYEVTLQGIRVFLFVTFAAVVVSTLSECQPFDHYWQVRPDPGPHCRQGFAQLITMGTCDIVTDILLVAFPIPIVLRSGQTWKRKTQLVFLFSLSLVMIGITATRMPEVVKHRGRQQYRTVWASCEILASASVSNAVILGSFLRDKGTKKNKFRSHSVTDSIDRASIRRPTTASGMNGNDSDEDLFRVLGMRVPEHLREKTDAAPRPAQAMPPASRHASRGDHSHRDRSRHHGRSSHPQRRTHEDRSSSSSDSLHKPVHQPTDPDEIQPSPVKRTNASFLDVGGLLEANGPTIRPPNNNTTSPLHPANHHISPSRSPTPSTQTSSHPGTITQDFASAGRAAPPPRPLILSDPGDLLAPRSPSRASSALDRYIGRRQSDSHARPPNRHAARLGGVLGPHETVQSLKDAGGLMDERDGGVREDASAAALRRMRERGGGPGFLMSGGAGAGRRAPPQDDGGEGAELSDPGGLLR